MKELIKRIMLILICALMMTGCQGTKSLEELTEDREAQYITIYKDSKAIDAVVAYDTENIYIFYDDDKHELYDKIELPNDLYPDKYNYIYVDSSNLNNGSSDLEVYVDHDDQTESYILYVLNDDGKYEYLKDYSYFYWKKTNPDPLEIYYIYAGKLIADNNDNTLPDTYLIFGETLWWQLYDSNDMLLDEGFIAEDEYSHVHIMYSDTGNEIIHRSLVEYHDNDIYISDVGTYIYADTAAE